jgi:hypothetical protein
MTMKKKMDEITMIIQADSKKNTHNTQKLLRHKGAIEFSEH